MYRQPTQLNELVFMKKPGLPKIYSEINPLWIWKGKSISEARIKSTDLTTTWILLRMAGNKLFTLECNQKTLNWTGFHKFTSLKVSAPTIIGNCRTNPASPTDLNVVYIMMLNVEKILPNLGQPYPYLTVTKQSSNFGSKFSGTYHFFKISHCV